jgi:hypothetical protein
MPCWVQANDSRKVSNLYGFFYFCSIMSEPGAIKNREIFEDDFRVPESSDPKVQITESGIKLSASYFHYSFVSSFPPLAGSLYILFIQNDPKIDLFCALLSVSCLIIIFQQLRFYNTATFNLEKKILTVKRNVLRRIVDRNLVLGFKEIDYVDHYTIIASPAMTRYVIRLVLTGGRKIKLISTHQKDRAEELSRFLSLLIR